MKSPLFYLLFSLVCFQLAAQPYIKIPTDTNYYWRQHSTCGNYHYQIKYAKDTLVSGKIYNKYSQFGYSMGSAPCSPTFIKHGFLRQDTLLQQVFILDPSFIERPLYNFSKTTVGDTMLIYDISTNTNITYTTSHNYGRILEITRSSGVTRLIQQGVGSLNEGLYGPGKADLNTLAVEHLICHGKIYPFNEIVVPNVGFESWCYLMTGIESNASVTTVYVFPNPTSSFINIQNPTNEFNTYQLSNALGQIIYSTSGSQPIEKIDISQYPDGIYLLMIKSSSFQKICKIIKESK